MSIFGVLPSLLVSDYIIKNRETTQIIWRLNDIIGSSSHKQFSIALKNIQNIKINIICFSVIKKQSKTQKMFPFLQFQFDARLSDEKCSVKCLKEFLNFIEIILLTLFLFFA